MEKSLCTYEEGGLGLRSLFTLNEAANLKLCWDLMNSVEDWATILKSRVLRNGKVVNYHVYSSLWSSIKQEATTIFDNSCWKVGSGRSIDLWTDSWCGNALAETLNIHPNVLIWLPRKVSDIIQNQQWHIPPYLANLFPTLTSLVQQVVLPFEPLPDVLVWSGNDKGLLTLKDAYNFKRNHFPVLSWAKVIWCNDVPPSRSLLVWRIMLDKLSTDDKLMDRGFCLPSMCSLCKIHTETLFHLFFECEFAFGLRRWLATCLNLVLQFQSMEDIWSLCDRARSPQCRIVIKSAIINVLYAIWIARNNARFKDRRPNWKSSMSWVAANVVLAGNHTKALSSGTISDFSMLKAFMVTIHPTKPMNLKEVIWQPPPPQWIKCNTDGASTPTASACGGIFRNSNAEFLCAFASKTDMASAFSAELCGFMTAIEIADARGRRNMWIESDSMLVVNAYKSSNLVPWSLSNRWFNCIKLAGHMNIIVSHIFREGNHCADRLANVGLNLDRLTLWNDILFVIKDSFESNRLVFMNSLSEIFLAKRI
ncbi:unnamed protein product [Trifolium pratense]|uniref:Uncharacterized protein n=1 Tax=Trifolium pratense TaxID=57577 RepID=A0ACB0LQJ8_TRIPR|nr:unnamed protein product [Trifolium pratense]